MKIFFARIGFIFPILLSIILPYLEHGLFFSGNMIENCLSTFVFLVTCNFLGRNRWSLIAELIFLIGFNLFIFIEIAHLYFYNDFFSASTVFILLETSPAETKEFFSAYFDFKLLLIAISQSIFMVFSIVLLIKNYQHRKNHLLDFRLKIPFTRIALPFPILYLLGLGAFLFFLNLATHHRKYIISYTMVDGYLQYQKNHKAYQRLGNNKLGGAFSEVIPSNNEEEIFVLIIGESTTRNRMSLYGYERNTNPRLAAIKDELFIYKDVISPHTHTISVLSKVLTLANYESPDRKFDGSIIQLFNRAGYKTYWISTQQPIGLHETLVTGISNSCSEQYFLSSYNFVPKDVAILVPLEKVLSDSADKKLIVLHLMGTHIDYKNRYPKAFGQFKSKPKTDFKHQQAFDLINAYDNAVLYNDFVVSEVISKVRQQQKIAAVLYFSDHGEEVYESLNFAGHGGGIHSPSMYDIPYILWLSPEYQSWNAELIIATNRKYMTDDLLFSLADLANIQFKEFEAKRSIFHQKFIPRKRLIYQNKTYGDLYKSIQ